MARETGRDGVSRELDTLSIRVPLRKQYPLHYRVWTHYPPMNPPAAKPYRL